MKRVFGKKNKNTSRPRKSGTRKNRRVLEHINRCIALGVPAEKAQKMNTKQLRDLVRRPQATALAYSAA